jgi:hypothetical protein
VADAASGRGLADADRGRRQEERLASGQPADGSAPGHELDGSKLPFWPPAPDDLLAWDAVPAGAQPALCRMAAGAVPAVLGSARRRSRAELLRALGNAVVPEVAFVVGALVLELDRKLTVLGSRL